MTTARIDYPGMIEEMEAKGIDPLASCLICIPEGGKQLLLATIDRLTWKATYRLRPEDTENEDVAEYWDAIQDLVDRTNGGLAVDCNTLVASITNNIINEVNSVQTQNQIFQDACCYLETQPPTTPPPTDEPPPATSGEREELCIQAQIAHDSGLPFLQNVFDLGEVGGSLTAGAILILLGALTLPWALVALFVGYVVGLVLDEATDEVIEGWESIKHDIVCAILNSPDAVTAKAAVDLVIENYVGESGINQTTVPLFQAIYNQGTINKIWEKQFPDPGGYTATYCADCGDPVIGGYTYRVNEWEQDGTLAYGGFQGDSGLMNGSTNWEDIDDNIPLPLSPQVFVNCLPGLAGMFSGYDELIEDFDADYTQQAINIGVRRPGIGFTNLAIGRIDNFAVAVTFNGGVNWLLVPVTIEFEGTPNPVFTIEDNVLVMTEVGISGNTAVTCQLNMLL